MPKTSWGKGREVVLVGPEGGALGGVAVALRGAGFRVTRCLPAGVHEVFDVHHVAVVYVDAATATALKTMAAVRARHPEVPVVLVRSAPTAMDVADAMRAGAADFLTAGSPDATILARLHDTLHEPESVDVVARPATAGPPGLVGASPPMIRLFHAIERVARFHASVLVLGESGTGKELIARAIHDGGGRAAHPFVAVNCATLGKDLLENELFGHERGAFTGADRLKKGLFELADGGTLFLDEIGEMDTTTQAKLLRVLERSEFRRVGGTEKLKVDVNVVTATNRDLRAAIASGRFREDLYYRLKVVALEVPPLRERREDIPALVEEFIAAFGRRHGARVRGITPEAMRRLVEHDWPGNVRELKNVIESAAMLTDEDVLQTASLDQALGARVSSARTVAAPARSRPSAAVDGALHITLPATLADVERELIVRTLQSAPTRAEAARRLGIGLRTLYTKMKQYPAD